jgi:hypothetical protein
MTKKAVKKAIAPKPAKPKTAKSKTSKLKPGKSALPPSVGVNMYGMAKFLKAVHSTGHEPAFNAHLTKKADTTVRLNSDTLDRIKSFIKSKPDLAAHPAAQAMADCDCDPDDPYCICYGNQSSIAD